MRGFWITAVFLSTLSYAAKDLPHPQAICSFILRGTADDILAEDLSALDALQPVRTDRFWRQWTLRRRLNRSAPLQKWFDACLVRHARSLCERIVLDFPTLVEFDAGEMQTFETFISNPRIQGLWMARPGRIEITYDILTSANWRGSRYQYDHGTCETHWPYQIKVSCFKDGARAAIFMHEMAHRFWFADLRFHAPFLIKQVQEIFAERGRTVASIGQRFFPRESYKFVDEYWAYGVSAYFYDGPDLYQGNEVYLVSNKTLELHDPEFYDLLTQIFGERP